MATQVLERIVSVRPKKAEAGTVHWLNDCIERGQREVFAETIMVTPGLANAILNRNENNRNIRPVKVAQFATDMRAGRWVFNGEPVIVAKTGELNDGQHRLNAIIEANTPSTFLFVFGVERETRTTVDQGTARNAGDYLSMGGAQNANVTAAIARAVIAYERSGGQDIAQAKYVTNAEILSRIAGDPGMEAAATFAVRQRPHTKCFCSPSAIGTAYYVLRRESPADATEFMEQVCTGENLRKLDPAFAVRERLWTTNKYAGQKLEVIFRGWNAYRSNRPLKLAKVLGNFPALV